MNKQIQSALKQAFKIIKAQTIQIESLSGAAYDPATGRPTGGTTTTKTTPILEVPNDKLNPGEKNFLVIDASIATENDKMTLANGEVYIVKKITPAPIGGFATLLVEGRGNPGLPGGKRTWAEK